mgnify:CR=1 FL=1
MPDMESPRFDDLLRIRAGDQDLTMGYSPSRIETIRTLRQWRLKAEALREILWSTMGRRPEGIECEPDVAVVAQEDRGAYVERRIEYSVEPDERIDAYVLVPMGLRKPVPGVLCLHPTTRLGKEQTVGREPTPAGRDRAYAAHLAERGYVTFAYDLMSAGKRRFPRRREFDTEPFYARHPEWSARGKDLWDAARALDVLASLREVDPERLGSIGHSQGGGITLHLAAVDERVRAAVSSCGKCPQRMSRNPYSACRTGWWVGRPALRPYCLTGKHFPIDMHECLALAAPRAVLVIQAVNDFKYALEEQELFRAGFGDMMRNVEKVYALHRSEDRVRCILHQRGHGFEAEQREAAYAFLDEMLGVRADA